jgi:hypothetical protein
MHFLALLAPFVNAQRPYSRSGIAHNADQGFATISVQPVMSGLFVCSSGMFVGTFTRGRVQKCLNLTDRRHLQLATRNSAANWLLQCWSAACDIISGIAVRQSKVLIAKRCEQEL